MSSAQLAERVRQFRRSVRSQYDELPPTPERINDFQRKTNGSYSLVANLNKSQVNPGGEISVGVYITGFGNINWNKLYVNISAQNLLMEDKTSDEQRRQLEDNDDDSVTHKELFEQEIIPGKVTVRRVLPSSSPSYVSDPIINAPGSTFGHGGIIIQESEVATPSSTIVFNNDVFAVKYSGPGRTMAFPPITSENSYPDEDSNSFSFGKAPVQYRFNISEDAVPGHC